MDDPYTQAELKQIREDSKPTRGLYCKKCGHYIPQFGDLSDAQLARVQTLLREGRAMMAIIELSTMADCPFTWAKLWVTHRGRPEYVYGTPCPFCG
ncbi:MAG TPA: hypothetical protein VJV05_15205, partial [Pyrinomonadaceae bacterium]|nr:hypothetical protein [Pyrinomonadaceae bacterium]